MSAGIEIKNIDIKKKMLENISKEVNGNWERVAKYVPLVISSIFMHIFQTSGARFGRWQQPGIWTKLLRAKTGKKYTNETDIAAHQVKPLQDTGILKMSFTPRAPHSHYGFGDRTVYGGSNLDRARKLNDGSQSTFQFGPQQQSRLEKNLRKTLPGSKPKTTPTGRQSRAKKNWNPYFFITRASMKKSDGKSYSVKPRQIEPKTQTDITSAEWDAIKTAIDRGIDEITGRLNK